MNDTSISKVCVIGLGYIGLPTAAMFASRRINVVGVDVNQRVIDTINKGEIHIVEPELDMIVHAAVNEGYLKATDKPEEADAFLIAVPTPFKTDHEPDLSYIEAAAQSIAPVLRKGNLVILESTSPVGTTEQLAKWLSLLRPDLKFPVNGEKEIDVCIAYCPERVLPGRVVHELVNNERTIGGLTESCSKKAIEIYQIFVQGELHISNARTAEMCKLTENAFRDLNIAFANELSIICDSLDIDVWQLISLANHHPRVNVLQPGPGVGGHCIAIDPWFIVHKTPDLAKLIRMAREVNTNKPGWVVRKLKDSLIAHLKNNPDKKEKDVNVAFLGLSFKPNIDDLRESPALSIVENFVSTSSANILVVEPNVKELPTSLSSFEMLDLDKALDRADIVVLLVSHNEFNGLEDKVRRNQKLIKAVKA